MSIRDDWQKTEAALTKRMFIPAMSVLFAGAEFTGIRCFQNGMSFKETAFRVAGMAFAGVCLGTAVRLFTSLAAPDDRPKRKKRPPGEPHLPQWAKELERRAWLAAMRARGISIRP